MAHVETETVADPYRSRGVKLKKLKDPSHAPERPRWIWQLRWVDAVTHAERSERIGYYCLARESWRPPGRQLARLSERDAQAAREQMIERQQRRDSGLFIAATEATRERFAELCRRAGEPAGLAFERMLDVVDSQAARRFEEACREFGLRMRPTLDELMADWVDRKRSNPPASWDELTAWFEAEGMPNAGHRSRLEARTAFRLFRELCPELVDRWQTLERDEARVYQVRLVGRGDKPMTVRKRLTYMRSLWNACRRTWVRGNPWAELAFPKVQTDAESWHYYSAAEVAALLAAATAVWKARIRLAWKSGLRPGEIDHLRSVDVDWAGERVIVRRHAASETTLEWLPKDRDSRTVAVDGDTLLLLRRLKAKASPGNPYLFVSERRWRQALALQAAGKWRPDMALINGRKKAWDQIVKTAGLAEPGDGPLVFYSLRKTCCCDLLEDGVPGHEVQAMLGHASLTTTMTWYSKVNKAEAERRIRAAQAKGRAG